MNSEIFLAYGASLWESSSNPTVKYLFLKNLPMRSAVIIRINTSEEMHEFGHLLGFDDTVFDDKSSTCVTTSSSLLFKLMFEDS